MPLTPRIAVLPLVAVLGLTGCGGGSAEPTKVESHNSADVAFAGDMVLHHQQAVEMAQLVLDRGTTPKVKDLASRIKAAQDPEVTQLTAFLTSVGGQVPTETQGHGGGHSVSAPGMMSHDQLAELEDLSGTALEKLFLQLMVEHHEGAIEMSAEERDEGDASAMTTLAEQITTTQTAEIAEMKALLATYA